MDLDLRLQFGSRFQPKSRGKLKSTSVWLAARMHYGCGRGTLDRGEKEVEKEEQDKEEKEGISMCGQGKFLPDDLQKKRKGGHYVTCMHR